MHTLVLSYARSSLYTLVLPGEQAGSKRSVRARPALGHLIMVAACAPNPLLSRPVPFDPVLSRSCPRLSHPPSPRSGICSLNRSRAISRSPILSSARSSCATRPESRKQRSKGTYAPPCLSMRTHMRVQLRQGDTFFWTSLTCSRTCLCASALWVQRPCPWWLHHWIRGRARVAVQCVCCVFPTAHYSLSGPCRASCLSPPPHKRSNTVFSVWQRQRRR